MHAKSSVTAALVTVGVLVVAGCGSDSSSAPGGGVMQEIAEVNLNTNGVSPGGANTAAAVSAVNVFVATLDDTQRDQVEYDLAENKWKRTLSHST